MNIGLTRNSYPEKRCITTSSEHNYIFSSYSNILSYFRKLPIVNNKVRDFIFVPFYNPQISLYHSFNDICITNKKWVVTFETMLPRFLDLVNCHKEASINYQYSEVVNLYLKKIAAPNCLQVIAISNSALKIQQELLKSYPEIKDVILRKCTVIYPPQEVLINKDEIFKKNYTKLKLIFVGRLFYLKGGSEVVLAIEELISENAISENDIELTLVGNLNNKNNKALGRFQDSEEYFSLMETIIKQRKNIIHVPNIESNRLLKLIEKHDIGLLTTWADTFGFSMLEFQAGGCPVISTNIRALPEINNSEIGWMINIDTNNLGELVIDSYEKKQAIRRVIIDGLKSAILECLENKELVRQKAIKALDRIEKVHSIEKYNKKLTQIYNQQ